MPAWYEDLRHYQHACGQPLLVGERFLGYQLMPVFQITPAHAVIWCPRCGRKLNLNDCRHAPAA